MTGANAKQPPTRRMKHPDFCALEGCVRRYYAKGWCRMHWERAYKHGDPTKVHAIRNGTLNERLAHHSRWEGECLVYTGRRQPSGHGQMEIDGKPTPSHRVGYEIAYGPIPKGMFVRHKCDNPPCINPMHLEVGTAADNSRDMVDRGRSLVGTRNHSAKLREDQIPEIIRQRSQGSTYKSLAMKYGVGASTIGRVVRRTHWKHVKECQ